MFWTNNNLKHTNVLLNADWTEWLPLTNNWLQKEGSFIAPLTAAFHCII